MIDYGKTPKKAMSQYKIDISAFIISFSSFVNSCLQLQVSIQCIEQNTMIFLLHCVLIEHIICDINLIYKFIYINYYKNTKIRPKTKKLWIKWKNTQQSTYTYIYSLLFLSTLCCVVSLFSVSLHWNLI